MSVPSSVVKPAAPQRLAREAGATAEIEKRRRKIRAMVGQRLGQGELGWRRARAGDIGVIGRGPVGIEIARLRRGSAESRCGGRGCCRSWGQRLTRPGPGGPVRSAPIPRRRAGPASPASRPWPGRYRPCSGRAVRVVRRATPSERGKRPKFTFIGLEGPGLRPAGDVMHQRAHGGGGGGRGGSAWPAISAAAMRPASSPMAALST